LKDVLKIRLDDSVKRVYVAGKMRGEPCYNFESFFFWARILRLSGYDVVNPAQIDTEKMFDGWQYTEDQYPDVLLHDLHEIKDVDAILLLEGWENSVGATAERAFGIAIGKKIYEAKGIV